MWKDYTFVGYCWFSGERKTITVRATTTKHARYLAKEQLRRPVEVRSAEKA